MATVLASVAAVDQQHPGVNLNNLGFSPLLVDVFGAMADDDDVKVSFSKAGDSRLPPKAVSISRHTGGDMTSAASATFALNNGDTLVFSVDPDNNGVFEEIVHALAGVTNGAATAAQIAASINADTKLSGKVVAVAGLTANAVTLFVATPRGKALVTGGTASALLAFPGTGADSKKRVYVSQSSPVLTAGIGFSWSFNADTNELTVKNETGGAVNRVQVAVWR